MTTLSKRNSRPSKKQIDREKRIGRLEELPREILVETATAFGIPEAHCKSSGELIDSLRMTAGI